MDAFLAIQSGSRGAITRDLSLKAMEAERVWLWGMMLFQFVGS